MEHHLPLTLSQILIVQIDLLMMRYLIQLIFVSLIDFEHLVMLVDNEPYNLFAPYLKKNGLTYPKKLIDTVLDNLNKKKLFNCY